MRVAPLGMPTISGRGVITSRTWRSPNRNTFCSSSASDGSNVPSASPMSISERSSLSVIESRSDAVTPSILAVLLVIASSARTMGSSIVSMNLSGRAYINATRSER